MKKCDFCVKSDDKGKCRAGQVEKDNYCEEALKRMEKAIEKGRE